MSTNFMSLIDETKVVTETVFTSLINSDLENEKAHSKPSDFKNVLHIGFDKNYEDVFKYWVRNENYFAIYFGIKGE